MMSQTTLVYGPAGCGKTTISAALAVKLGLGRILDDVTDFRYVDKSESCFHRGKPKLPPAGVLVLTESEAVARSFPGARVLSFAEAVEVLAGH